MKLMRRYIPWVEQDRAGVHQRSPKVDTAMVKNHMTGTGAALRGLQDNKATNRDGTPNQIETKDHPTWPRSLGE